MALYLDSALVSDAQAAVRFGWVHGITTNPTLLAKSPLPPAETLTELARLTSGPVFYQLVSSGVGEMMNEAQHAKDLLGDQLVLKIPPTKAGFTVTTELSSSINCAITAIFSPAQALVAEAAGAHFVIIYYNRILRLLPDGARVLADTIVALASSHTEILVASIKSPAEAVAAHLAGCHHLTMPLEVLTGMMQHDLSLEAVEEFSRQGVGIISWP